MERFWISHRARPGHFAPRTSSRAASRAHVFLSSARRLFGIVRRRNTEKTEEMKDKQKRKKERTWAEAARMVNHKRLCLYRFPMSGVFFL